MQAKQKKNDKKVLKKIQKIIYLIKFISKKKENKHYTIK